MATTSSNKQPLLVDRPLLEVASLVATTHAPGATEPGTGTQATLLVDCTANDGACLDDIWLIQRKDNNVIAVVLFVAASAQTLGVSAGGSTSAAHFLGRFSFGATVKAGEVVSWKMPHLLAPVPHAGANVDNAPPQYRGLLLPRGKALWAAAEVATASNDAPNIAVQGGFY